MIIKERLAMLEMCYCINLIRWNEKDYCIAASEAREGKTVLIDINAKIVSEIIGLQGGIMAIIPIPEFDGEFLAIEKFYPVFDSAEARIIRVKMKELKDRIEVECTVVKNLPFVHRILLTGEIGKRKIIAATLCKNKKTVDDWSQAGSVYEIALDNNFQVIDAITIIHDIHRNHGMYEYKKPNGSYLMITGDEGIWAIDRNGCNKKISVHPTSDLCLFDIDQDGVDEIICIAPFHGNNMEILKNIGEGLEIVSREKIEFGHAIWSGNCENTPVIISCSRGGDKNTLCFIPVCHGKTIELSKLVIDIGVGASNIIVDEKAEHLVLYCANHEVGEIARYRISLNE